MSVDFHRCERCGAGLGIAGTSSGSDDDIAADESFDAEVEYHQSGQCAPAEAAAPAAGTGISDQPWRPLRDATNQLDAAAKACATIDMRTPISRHGVAYVRGLIASADALLQRVAAAPPEPITLASLNRKYGRVQADANDLGQRVATQIQGDMGLHDWSAGGDRS